MADKAASSKAAPSAAINSGAWWGYHLAYAGITAAMVLPQFGAAYGTSMSASALTTLSGGPDGKVMKGMIPIVMSGVIALYGLGGAIFMHRKAQKDAELPSNGAKYLAAGLSLGLACLASGYAIGQVGNAGLTEYAKRDDFFVPTVLSLIYGEALGLYGAIAAYFLLK